MLIESEARALALRVVTLAKSTAHVDTGALKRSISFTYVKNEIIFRQLFYGVYNNNSELEKYAEKLIPRHQPWKVILTKFGGEIVEVSRTSTGRKMRSVIQPWNAKQTTSNINKLIEIAKARKLSEAENDD